MRGQYRPIQFQMSLDRDTSMSGPKYFYMEWPSTLTQGDANDIREIIEIALRGIDKYVLTDDGEKQAAALSEIDR